MNKKNIIILASALATIFFAYIAFCYWQSYKNDEPYELSSIQPLEKEYLLGDRIKLSATIISPLHNIPNEALFSNGEGIMKFTSTDISLSGIGFKHLKWDVSIIVKPFRLGMLEPGAFDVRYNYKDLNKILNIKIPKIKIISQGAKSDKLELAEKINLSFYDKVAQFAKKYKYWLISALIATLSILTYFIVKYIKREKKLPPPIPAWQIALDEICTIRKNIKENKISNEKAVSLLTDSVRVFLEQEFEINAPAQTTKEFLQNLNNENSPLNQNNRDFLKEFILSAEFIKFANSTADENILDEALDNAEKLVLQSKKTELNEVK